MAGVFVPVLNARWPQCSSTWRMRASASAILFVFNRQDIVFTATSNLAESRGIQCMSVAEQGNMAPPKSSSKVKKPAAAKKPAKKPKKCGKGGSKKVGQCKGRPWSDEAEAQLADMWPCHETL